MKEGDHEIANNNRPVSLLPVASKVCERVALNQLATYMNNRRLTEHQSGNKKLHSCETLNVMMTDKVLEAMDSKKLTLVVLLELSKAFDSIDHCRLLSKLQALGIGRTALKWIRSYLTGRQQYDRIGSETSNLAPITHGVPQGSILGPALFNLYINDLPAVPESGSLESFVDDSKLYLSFPVKDATAVVQLINEDLAEITAWCCYNGLLINPDKTNLLVMGNRQMLQRLPKDVHVTLPGKEVTPSNSARDLGIEMDATLSFDEHITNTVLSCFASLCQINRMKHLFDSKSLEKVIHALVFSRLFYRSPVWSSKSQKNVSKLKSVQNFAASVVTGSRKFEHITPVLRDLNLPPVNSMLKYTVGILTFKCVKGLAPRYLCSHFVTRATVHDRNTRNKNKLDIPGYKFAAGQRSFLYRSV